VQVAIKFLLGVIDVLLLAMDVLLPVIEVLLLGFG
jgi:hypothetical protein